MCLFPMTHARNLRSSMQRQEPVNLPRVRTRALHLRVCKNLCKPCKGNPDGKEHMTVARGRRDSARHGTAISSGCRVPLVLRRVLDRGAVRGAVPGAVEKRANTLQLYRLHDVQIESGLDALRP